MKVLVTGASGMLGGAVARALAERGDEVTVFQRHPAAVAAPERGAVAAPERGAVAAPERGAVARATDQDAALGSIAEVLGDITDAVAVRAAVAGHDAVIHLAARVAVTGPWAPFEAINVHGTHTLLAAAEAAGVSRFVQVSSPSVAHAGTSLVGAPAGPAAPEQARGYYARSKALAEQAALAADAPGFAVVAVRPHLVWGPGDTQLVGRIIERARAGRLALVDRGAALIDTTYVDNAASAMVAALDHADDAHGQAFVVSNGQPRTVAELVRRICAAAGVDAPRLHVPYPVARAGGAVAEWIWATGRRTDDPPMTRFLAEQLATAHWFDQRRTHEVLRWTPAVSLDEGFVRLAASFTQPT